MHRSRDKNSQLPARKREQNSATPMAWYSRQFQRRVAVSSQSTAIYEKYSHQTTLLHSLNGLFSRTTWVSRHQKGKTRLARDDGVLECSGSSWTICKQPAPRSRRRTTPTPHHSIFTGRMLFLTPNQQCRALKAKQRMKYMKPPVCSTEHFWASSLLAARPDSAVTSVKMTVYNYLRRHDASNCQITTASYGTNELHCLIDTDSKNFHHKCAT